MKNTNETKKECLRIFEDFFFSFRENTIIYMILFEEEEEEDKETF